MNPYVRPSVWTDVEFLSTRLRRQDVEELKATGSTPLSALSHGFNHSSICLTLISPTNGEPIGMAGVAPSISNLGIIWMLGTDGVTEHSTTFLRHAKPMLDFLFEQTGAQGFYNFVHKANTVHVRWLKWMGFTLSQEHIFPSGEPFIEFSMLRKASNV